MENSIYLGLSRQLSLQRNMEIISNNVANMNTAGYRGQNPVFEEYISDPRYGDDPMSFVTNYGQYQMTHEGPMTQTGNPLDVALNGEGFMAIQMPGGQIGYTRDGHFEKTQTGTLVTSAGYAVLGQGGPIVIPDNAREISIDERGVISTQNGPIGQLQVVEFENAQELEPVGNNLYVTEGVTNPAEKTLVQQGFIEGSNVNGVVEMTNMIEILRDFQSTRSMLDKEHERLRTAIQKLTQV